MKKDSNNFWNRLSLSHKINFIGSLMLMASLFLNWFSDVDVYRSGDLYTGLTGPMYFVGINLLLLAVTNLVLISAKALNVRLLAKMDEVAFGKYQLIGGFVVMYLLMIVNSVYFHPQFGLNILSKKSEIGVFVAMVAAVMICVGGYMGYRKKFEETPGNLENLEKNNVTGKEELVRPIEQYNTARVASTLNNGAVQVSERNETMKVEQREVRYAGGNEGRAGINRMDEAEKAEILAKSEAARKQIKAIEERERPVVTNIGGYSDRDPRGKTDFERARMYENLKKVMMKDTLTPEQRRKEREKQAKENAFSANFGKENRASDRGEKRITGIDDLLRRGQLTAKSAGSEETSGSKKPQMYRMDL